MKPKKKMKEDSNNKLNDKYKTLGLKVPTGCCGQHVELYYSRLEETVARHRANDIVQNIERKYILTSNYRWVHDVTIYLGRWSSLFLGGESNPICSKRSVSKSSLLRALTPLKLWQRPGEANNVLRIWFCLDRHLSLDRHHVSHPYPLNERRRAMMKKSNRLT